MSVEKIFLLPGDLVTVNKPTHLATLLGSCVSVCLDNPYRGVACMNHFMLPAFEGSGVLGRYGDASINEILRRAFALDPDPRHYRARLYGGGAVVGHLNSSATGGIGDRNIEIARKILAQRGIKISSEDVGGTRGRRIDFNTENSVIDCRVVGADPDNSKKEKSVGVLIVDDSRMVRRVIRSSLEGFKGLHIVGEATHPFEAREKILSCDPDVITLDIEMPRMDGITFLKNLMRSYPKPVVIMSSLAKKGSEVERAALESGAWGVFDKEKLELFKGVEAMQQLLAPVLLKAASGRR